jgi:hypothetical protein
MKPVCIIVQHAVTQKDLFVLNAFVIPRVGESLVVNLQERARSDFPEFEWNDMVAASTDELYIVVDVMHQYTMHNIQYPEQHTVIVAVQTLEEYEEGDDDGGGNLALVGKVRDATQPDRQEKAKDDDESRTDPRLLN